MTKKIKCVINESLGIITDGNSASHQFQRFNHIIDVAKEKIFDTNKTVSQIAYKLGFKYPQHFARVFKQRVGRSPLEYRTAN